MIHKVLKLKINRLSAKYLNQFIKLHFGKTFSRYVRRTRYDYFKVNHNPENLPYIDLVIITYNSQKYILRCFRSILTGRYPLNKLNVIIVDNDSKDDTPVTIRSISNLYEKKLLNLSCVFLNKNLGFGKAINLAIDKFGYKEAKYILLMNPDAYFYPDTILELVAHALSMEKARLVAFEARQLPYEHPKFYDPVSLETDWFSGSCVLISKDAFLKVKGFDENIFLYCEDVDISWRLRSKGYKLAYIPKATIWHDTYRYPEERKFTQFYYSLQSDFILRKKFGTLLDIIIYYLSLFYLYLIEPELEYKKAIMDIARLTFTSKLKLEKINTNFKPIFLFGNYGFRRKGDFHASRKLNSGPLVSVIIRTKNRNPLLREALQSIRNQTYSNIEVIVVEDGSDTATKILEEFSDLHIKYISNFQKVGNRSFVGNLGLKQSEGEYICFLDDDDLFFADHIETLVSAAIDRKSLLTYSCGFCSKTKYLSENPLRYVWNMTTEHCSEFNRHRLKKENYIPLNTFLFHRSLYEKEGGLDENLQYLEDWDLLRRYAQHCDFSFVKKTTSIYNIPYSAYDRQIRQTKLDGTYFLVYSKSLNY